MHFSITSCLFIPLSFSSVFEFSWTEMCRINKIAVPPSLPPWLSPYWLWQCSEGISVTLKRQRGGEIKVISLYLPLFFIFSELCIYSIPTSSVFHFLSFPPPSPPLSVPSQPWGRNQLVTTPRWCPDTAIKIVHKRMGFLFLSLPVWVPPRGPKRHEETKPSKTVHPFSFSLALFTWLWPSHPWDFLFSHGS